MNIYSVKRNYENVYYDEYEGFVIVAESDKRAIEIAVEQGCEELQSEDDVKINMIGRALKGIEEGIILYSFREG